MIRSRLMTRRSWNKHSLVLDDPNPARPLAVTRAQPDVVLIREPDLQRRMGPQTVGCSEFFIEPISQLEETRLGLIIGYCPFRSVLGVLFAAAMWIPRKT